MGKISLLYKEIEIDTNRDTFDMQEIQNRRFMFNPKSGTMIIGRQYGEEIESSHEEEHKRISSGELLNDFVCGWVGTGKGYENGVIHFAPPITMDDGIENYNRGFSTLETFARNGAVSETVIRGFPGEWEQTLDEIIDPRLIDEYGKDLYLAQTENEPERVIYRAIRELAPGVINGEYEFMRFQAGDPDMWLTLQHLSEDNYTLTLYYNQPNGTVCDTDMFLKMDGVNQKATAVTLAQHPNIRYEVNEQTDDKLQSELNGFLGEWLKSIKEQGYIPEDARLSVKGNEELTDFMVYFNADKKPFNLAYMYESNGITVFNRLEQDGNHGMKEIARVNPDYSVDYFASDVPKSVITVIAEKSKEDSPHFKLKNIAEPHQTENGEKYYPPYEGELPDPTIGISERNEYGYVNDGLLPLNRERALEMYDNGVGSVYKLYKNNAEDMIDERNDILIFDGIFGIEVEDWERYKNLGLDLNAAEKEQPVGYLVYPATGEAIPFYSDTAIIESYKNELDSLGINGIEFRYVADGELEKKLYSIYKNEMGEMEEPDHKPEIDNTITEPDYPNDEIADNIDVMPDPGISYSELGLYGYQADDILPLLKDRALELYDADQTVYMLFSDNTESMVFTREDILSHEGIFGIDAAEWIASKEYAEAVKTLDNSEASKEAALLFGSEDSFAIYQLKRNDETRDLRFEPFDRLERKGLSVERKNYELVYHSPITDCNTLDSLYAKFNYNRPEDFKAQSISISDVIVMQNGGVITSHYVDKAGFKELPAFLGNEIIENFDKEDYIARQLKGIINEQISNNADAGYLNESATKILSENIDSVNAKMYAISDLYESCMPTEIQTDTIDRLLRDELNKSTEKWAAITATQSANGKKPSILSQLDTNLKIVAQGKDTSKNTPTHNNNKEEV